MIVISGALVLVALVLLVLGLTMQDLSYVYASIAVSLVSFVFLVIGVLQRRGDSSAPATAEDAAAGGAAPGAAPVVTSEPATSGESGESGAESDSSAPEPGSGATVLVVPGRPRYHVTGCRYLSGRQPEEVDVASAREQYTPCGVCRPDEALALAEAEDDEPVAVDDSGVPGVEPTVSLDKAPADADEPDEEPDDADEPAVEPVRRRPAARGRTAAAQRRPAAKAASRRVVIEDDGSDVVEPADEPEELPARLARSSRSASSTRSTRAAAARTADATAERPAAPRKRATKASGPSPVTTPPAPAAAETDVPPAATAGTAAAAAPRKAAPRGRVVVIPDRGRYHKATCRFVRDADDTEDLTRGQAEKQGYQACGVCKP